MDAALFNAVGMDVALPLYCGYGGYCPFTAATMDAAFYTAVWVDAASFFRLLDAAPFDAVSADAAPFYAAVGMGAAINTAG